MKTCPKCAESVQDDAKICRYCGHSLSLFSSFASAKPMGCGTTLGLTFLVLLFISQCSDDGTTRSSSTSSSVSPAVASVNLRGCQDMIMSGRKAGVVVSTERDVRLIVNEWRWNALDWESKKGLAVALACQQSGGQTLGYEYVAVYSGQSGRKLADGIPGIGRFEPK